MEHNFNPNKGDYKYILNEEQRKKSGDTTTTRLSPVQKRGNRFWRWVIATFQIRSKKTNKLSISFPLLFELFYR